MEKVQVCDISRSRIYPESMEKTDVRLPDYIYKLVEAHACVLSKGCKAC